MTAVTTTWDLTVVVFGYIVEPRRHDGSMSFCKCSMCPEAGCLMQLMCAREATSKQEWQVSPELDLANSVNVKGAKSEHNGVSGCV